MAGTYIQRTQAAGNRRTFTISAWVKRCGNFNQYSHLFTFGPNPGAWDTFRFDNNNQLAFRMNNDGAVIQTNRRIRDTFGWMHLVLAVDTTQSTASDRVKIYVNGEQETSLNTSNYPSQNLELSVNHNGQTIRIGDATWSPGSQYFDGLMSHVHFCDGSALAPTVFGETDSTTGEWKIKTNPSFTPGTNGFTIFKDGMTITDQSANSNDFTLSTGTLTKTEDCPSNIFCTMNILDNQNQGSTFTAGNNKIEWNTNNKCNFGTMAVNSGKWYWELKFANVTGGANAMTGVCREVSRDPSSYLGHDSHGWAYYAVNGQKYHAGSGSSYGATWTTNDIIGVAFDADTRTLWFSKNGTWQNSATISEIAAGTTTNSMYTNFGTAGEFFFPATSGYDGNKIEYNFGNGYFSTTAVSSAGSNASNLGIFEYDVPNNFTALCTKGLNE
tara:strand:- start:110 stop:1432 length:1323 start_codon:yes stop_codon:yes gene_type:complete